MEITAVLEALRDHGADGPIEVVSDSTYVVNCFRDRWYVKWRAQGWRNSNRQPVANQDLWKPLLDLALAEDAQVTFRWVKGHSGDEMNDFVDELATTAADLGHGATRPPTGGDRGPDR
jgi:ribonuclease HI